MFSLKNRIKYKISKFLLFIAEPKMFSYKSNFQNVKIKNLRIGNTTFIDYKNKLFLKDNVYIGHFNFIEASNKIEIGTACQITNHVTITTHSSHHSIRFYGNKYCENPNKKGYISGSVEIGDFSYIGPYSTIMPKTKIGKACIVSAYSYVKGEFEDYSIISGNPAKKIGDVREKDNEFLSLNPELIETYLK